MAREALESGNRDDAVIAGPSPFFRLPAEVRMMIYDLAIFGGKNDFKVRKTDDPRKFGYQICPRKGTLLRPAQDLPDLRRSTPPFAITFTCRQAYLEAAPIWYTNVRFGFDSIKLMKSFIETVGQNRHLIRHIRVQVDISPKDYPDDWEMWIMEVRDFPCLQDIVIDAGKFCWLRELFARCKEKACIMFEKHPSGLDFIIVLGRYRQMVEVKRDGQKCIVTRDLGPCVP